MISLDLNRPQEPPRNYVPSPTVFALAFAVGATIAILGFPLTMVLWLIVGTVVLIPIAIFWRPIDPLLFFPAFFVFTVGGLFVWIRYFGPRYCRKRGIIR